MHAGNNEERFVLASLKEFVKTWGSGRAGSFQLVCDEGHAKLSMEFSLETPGSSHFTPSDGNQDTLKRDKRRKNPSTRDKSAQSYDVPSWLVRREAMELCVMSRITSNQIVLSPPTHTISQLAPRPRKVRIRKRIKSAIAAVQLLQQVIHLNCKLTEQRLRTVNLPDLFPTKNLKFLLFQARR